MYVLPTYLSLIQFKELEHPTPIWADPLPDSVSPPSDDTFLLVDSLEKDFLQVKMPVVPRYAF